MKAITLTTKLAHLRGLMFRITPTIAIFQFNKPQKVSIHTWFMLYPINVYFLDSDAQLIKTKLNLRPFSHYNPGIRSQYIVEIPISN